MNDAVEPFLTKARESLQGALSEMANGRYNNAANRAYYAAYQAAIVALLRAGFQSRNQRWDHEEVQAVFAGQLINRRKQYPADFRRILQDLATTRRRGDYGLRIVSAALAESAIRDTERFVEGIIGKG